MTNLSAVVFAVVLVCWLAFVSTLLVRKRPPVAADQKRDPSSITGVVLQALSYPILWVVWRPLFTSFLPFSKAVSAVLEIAAAAAAVASVVLVIAALKTLGKEWSITARVVTGHKLATEGPYRLVRHPIYTGMLGMLLATGIAVSYWPALLIALVIFLIGTIIRIRSEERLLRETFGAEFEAYTQRVPALLPGMY
ncbi:MAG TPA: isoprenylcysteine carboxylmethyltransferase family protein [Pyrinomonadaceae bacterium]|nr:isoprenylcysteine carboxylmethyltransferase family protein [Pyrinomonadaceae bacterium]